MTKMKHERIIRRMTVVGIIVGLLLLIVGFLVPPQGEIHKSVLIAVGEIVLLVNAPLLIVSHEKIKITTAHTSIEAEDIRDN